MVDARTKSAKMGGEKSAFDSVRGHAPSEKDRTGKVDRVAGRAI